MDNFLAAAAGAAEGGRPRPTTESKALLSQCKELARARLTRIIVDALDKVPAGWRVLDIGPKSIAQFGDVLKRARLVVWNGPLGVFEFPRFAEGTFAIARLLATTGATTVIGGGDSASAVKKAGVTKQMTHVSTGGGASLEYLEGRVLPGVAALTDRR